jgi:hypothetical protein
VRAVERAEAEWTTAFAQRRRVVSRLLDRRAQRQQRGRRRSVTACTPPWQTVREIGGNLVRLVLLEPVLGDEPREERAVHPPATSCRAGIDRNARVSSLKPTVL